MYKEGELRTRNGAIKWVSYGGATCKQYNGLFAVPDLQRKAQTGLWYCRLNGNPHIIEGEGDTPLISIANAIMRTIDDVQKKEAGIKALVAAIPTPQLDPAVLNGIAATAATTLREINDMHQKIVGVKVLKNTLERVVENDRA